MKFFIQCCLLFVTMLSFSVKTQGQATITVDTVINATCNASADGAILISVAGTPPFTYQWSNGAVTQDLTGLFSNSFVVTVTDGVGATTISNVLTVTAPPVINVVTDTVINILCAGDSTGAVDLTVFGGVPGYTYIWDNGAITQDVSGLPAGPINVTVTDANGCTASAKSISIDSVPPIIITLDSIVDVSCNGANDGSVSITVTGGTGGTYSYLWSNGATTQNLTGLGGGSYTVTVTDSNNCVMISGPHIVNEPNTLVVTLDSIQNVDCNGNANGAVFISVTGGTTNYSFNWSNGATTEDITGLSGGTYSVIVTDANGCVDSTGPHVVIEPPVLTLTLDSIQDIDCNGDADGAVFISVTGGTTNYTYAWSNTATTQDITGLNGGSYTVTVTDANGCTVSDTAYVVNEPTALVASLDSVVDVSCNGFGDGGVFITTTGGTNPYTYIWSNGVTTEDNPNLGGGSYTLTITDANGCSVTSGPHVVVEPAGMTVALDGIVDVSCNGAADGSVSITVTGGAPNYTYLWSNTAVTEDITGLSGGSYTVTVTDVNGCTISSGPHVVDEDSLIVITLDSINGVTCNGAADGAIGISVTGGVPAYSYNWSNTATTQDITGLNGGAYTVTVTDASGCTATDTAYVVNEPAVLIANLDSLQNIDCNGANNGAIFITTTGGTANYTFNWSNNATTEDLSGLGAGSYTLTVTDANGCTTTSGPHVISEPALLVVTLDSIDNVSCNGASDGAVFITATGGTGAYTYAWSNTAVTQNITGLSGGSYTVTVTDANGCTAVSGPHIVTEAPALVITLDSIDNVSCNGAGDGAVFITATGGVAAYTYAWSNTGTTQNITGLSGGSYTLTVTDAAGCTATSGPHVVVEPAQLVATLDSINAVSCNGGSDGGVFISIGGGTIPFAYNWSNGATTEDITGVVAGNYTVTVTDTNGCVVISGPHTVTEPTALVITLDSIDNVSCNGASDGAVFITATGGTGAYTYAWSNTAVTQNITGLSGGSYTVTVTDANGCTAVSGPHVVTEAPALVITLDSIDNVSCNGAGDGAVFITATGGVAAYTYAWSNTGTTQNITGLSGGSYTLTVTDATGCTATSGPHVVVEPAQLVATLDSINAVSCNGGSDGGVFISIAGGTIPFAYNWSNGATTEDITGVVAGNYTVTVTDTNGCVVISGPHTVTEPTALVITLDSIDNVSCNGASDGAVFITATGGTGAYTYAWSNTAVTQNITGLSGGSYTVTVTDANGCTAVSGPHIVTEAPALVITLDSIDNVSCNGAGDGAVFITATGGVAAYTYAWSNTGTTQNITGLGGGSYTLTVTDAAGCTATSGPHVVAEPAQLVATLDSINAVSCNGGSDGGVFISIGGGTIPFAYNWSNGATTEDITGVVAGNYTVTVTDTNGCVVISGPHTVTEPTALVITLDSIDNVSCNGAGDGAVFITATGGTGAYTYAWSNTGVTQNITGLGGGSYTVTVTDANGCVVTFGPITIVEPTALTITIDTFKNESCFGIIDGFINTTAAGGTTPYTYLWSNGATVDDITGLIAGTYTLTVTDSNNCVAIGSVTINDIPTITVALDGIDSVSCNGLSDGAINITTTLGAPGYTWVWSTGAGTEDLTGVTAGSNYTVTVTDALGCTITAGAYAVEEPDVLTISLDNITDVSCNGAADGAVSMTTTGGTSTYTYLWSDGQNTEDITGLSNSTNTVTVTDFNGCTATSGPHVVNEATAIVVTLDNIDSVSCNGASDGAVAITVVGGVPTYTYNWNNGAGTNEDLVSVSGNSYIVTITDAAGCTVTSGPHVVDEPSALSLTITPTVPLEGCLGEPFGVLDAAATGGTGAITYQWSNASTTASNNGLNTGVYSLTITDANGCTTTGIDSIQNPVRPIVNPFVGQAPVTDTTVNWSDIINIDAGNDQTASGVNYVWTDVTNLGNINFVNSGAPATDVQPEPDMSGTYTLLVTATSGDGCVDTGSVYITVNINDLVGIPTAFTPNGDGVNDFFRPANLDDQFIMEFKIFNRWGQLIFDDTKTTDQWDGRFNGVEQPTEVYIYVLRYQVPGQEARMLRGEFTLLR